MQDILDLIEWGCNKMQEFYYSYMNRRTQREIDRQMRLEENYRRIEERKNRELQRIYERYNQQKSAIDRENSEEWNRYREEVIERFKEENREEYQETLCLLKEQYEDKIKLKEFAEQNFSAFEQNLKKTENSYLRSHSLKNTQLMMEEIIYKTEGYIYYLNTYQHDFKKIYEETGKILKPFSLVMTEDLPYVGKCYSKRKNDFNEYYQCAIDDTNIKLVITRSERTLFDQMDQDDMINFMVLKLYEGERPNAVVSISYGEIKTSIGTRIGLEADVTRVNKGIIGLKYYEKQLNLYSNNRINQYSRTPIGTKLQVYVKDYDFALKRIVVTEKIQESLKMSSFNMVPLFFGEQEVESFQKYIQKNGWDKNDSIWMIAPQYDENHLLVGLKLQQDNDYVLESVFEKKNGREYLRYVRLLDRSSMIKYGDDVFVTCDITFQIYLDNVNVDFNETIFDECQFFRQYLASEFLYQEKIRVNSPMAVYLKQWTEVTLRLMEAHEYPRKVIANVLDWDYITENKHTFTRIYVDNISEINKFYKESIKDELCKGYAAEIYSGEKWEKKRCWLEEQNGQVVILIKEKIEDAFFVENNYELNVYIRHIPYVDKQHAKAFDIFHMRLVANESIKKAILNISDMEYVEEKCQVTHFNNPYIACNENQIRSVLKGCMVSPVFMIQGPPGTGKTTVIKEIIMQELEIDHSSKILVVSQANVAVDNVLRGIMDISPTIEWMKDIQMVRCGNEERIAEDVQTISYEGKKIEYINHLEQLSDNQNKLSRKWLNIVSETKNTEVVSECLLKNYDIIGATCVGLESNRYGLNNINFDLVIIDEAGKALPGELLIPINKAKRLIIIGDHKQLPPVIDTKLYANGEVEYDDVVERKQQEDFLNRSFFQRLYEECPEECKCMLDVQFRMPPVIAGLVNIFYDNRLKNGENCDKKESMLLGNNLIFLDMNNDPEYKESLVSYGNGKTGSPHNIREVEVVVELIKKVRGYYKKRIVVITPYKKQKTLILGKIKSEKLALVNVNTIDAFQGDEEDLVIYCMTRSHKRTKYFSDPSRLNVAFSRARNTLIIVGSSTYIGSYPKKHIMNTVYEYLKKNAKIIDFVSFMSCDLMYNPGYAGKKEKVITNNSGITQFKIAEKYNTELKQKRYCLVCKRELQADENDLCINCLLSAEEYHCACCNKKLEFSYVDKYIAKKEKPELCSDCSKVKCDICGQDVFETNRNYEKSIEHCGKYVCKTCYDSREKTIVKKWNCLECGQEQCLTQNQQDMYDYKGWQLPKYCKKCKRELSKIAYSVICEQCNKEKIELTKREVKYYENQGRALPVICKKCYNSKVVLGKCSCGKDIIVSRQQKRKFDESLNKNWIVPAWIHCEECRKKKAPKSFTSRWLCRYCAKWFDRTVGEVDDLTQVEKIAFERGQSDFYVTKQGRYFTSCPSCREKGEYKWRKYGKGCR